MTILVAVEFYILVAVELYILVAVELCRWQWQ